MILRDWNLRLRIWRSFAPLTSSPSPILSSPSPLPPFALLPFAAEHLSSESRWSLYLATRCFCLIPRRSLTDYLVGVSLRPATATPPPPTWSPLRHLRKRASCRREPSAVNGGAERRSHSYLLLRAVRSASARPPWLHGALLPPQPSNGSKGKGLGSLFALSSRKHLVLARSARTRTDEPGLPDLKLKFMQCAE